VSVNIQILEGQVDSLIKLVLVEERKKQILLEDTAWERTPPGKPKDPIGYWKILFDQLPCKIYIHVLGYVGDMERHQ
jgi:hypothetical protein